MTTTYLERNHQPSSSPFLFQNHFRESRNDKADNSSFSLQSGQLYWNCLRSAKEAGAENEQEAEKIALQKVKERYFDDFTRNKDMYLFVGTTREWHTRRSLNPFVIIGVFYPKKEIQGSLF